MFLNTGLFRKRAEMRLARRITQVRVEHLFSLKELAVKARMSAALLASIENGQEIPSLEMVDSLAAAMGVRVARLFYDDSGPVLTPLLTARLTLQQLADEPFHSHSFQSAILLTFNGLRAASAAIFAFITTDDRCRSDKPLPPGFPITNSNQQDETGSSKRWNDTNLGQ